MTDESPDQIIISWSCGCSVVRDATGKLYDQPGMFCDTVGHRAQVVKTSPEGERYREGGRLFE